MANRIVDNIYIIDSALNNVALPWNSGTRVAAVSFWSSDSSGAMTLAFTDTSDTILRAVSPSNGNSAQTSHYYLGGIPFSSMKVPVLTAGTGYIYLELK